MQKTLLFDIGHCLKLKKLSMSLWKEHALIIVFISEKCWIDYFFFWMIQTFSINFQFPESTLDTGKRFQEIQFFTKELGFFLS